MKVREVKVEVPVELFNVLRDEARERQRTVGQVLLGLAIVGMKAVSDEKQKAGPVGGEVPFPSDAVDAAVGARGGVDSAPGAAEVKDEEDPDVGSPLQITAGSVDEGDVVPGKVVS